MYSFNGFFFSLLFADIYIKRCSIFQLPFWTSVPCNEQPGLESVFSEMQWKDSFNEEKWENWRTVNRLAMWINAYLEKAQLRKEM